MKITTIILKIILLCGIIFQCSGFLLKIPWMFRVYRECCKNMDMVDDRGLFHMLSGGTEYGAGNRTVIPDFAKKHIL